MRRILALAAALLLLAGCGSRAPQADSTAKPQPVTIAQPETTRAAQPEGINIHYPVFPEYSAAVNTRIVEAACRALDGYDPEPEERLFLDIDCEVKLNTDELVSIVFKGMGYLTSNLRPDHFFYTMNLDVQTGEPVRLADKAILDDAFAQALHRVAKAALGIEEYELYKRDYIDCAYEDGFGFPQELAAAEVYFTQNVIGVVLPWKLSAGRWYVIEMPR